MRPERKAARDKAMSLKTVADLDELLESLNITDDERRIARLVLSRGWSYTRVAMETDFSTRHVRRCMERVYSKMA